LQIITLIILKPLKPPFFIIRWNSFRLVVQHTESLRPCMIDVP
jgi:hypothetical protein